MGFFDIFKALGRKSVPVNASGISPEEWAKLEQMASELSYRKLAFMAAVNLIANAVSRCEVKIFENGKETKNNAWYLYNVQPNHNQSAAEFWKILIKKLYADNEALIVPVRTGGLLIADSFSRDEYAVRPDRFSGVDARGLTLAGGFPADEVFYWTLGDESAKRVVDAIYTSYGNLIAYGIRMQQQSRGRRGVLTVDVQMTANPNYNKIFEERKNAQFKDFMSKDTAVLPIFNGEKYEELGQQKLSADAQTTRDIRAVVDDIISFTAIAFGIPPSLLLVDKLEISQHFEHFMSFCVNPLCEALANELTRKTFSRTAIINGSRVRFDTSRVRHVDIIHSAVAADKLISSGAVSPDELRELLGIERTGDDWAQKHYMTKNYHEAGTVQADSGRDDPAPTEGEGE